MRELPGRLVLLGHPVSHSLSPVFQNAALVAAGIDLRYEALDVPPGLLQVTLDDAKREGWAGNVTVPHKEAVFARCGELTPIARRVGAVNTFRAEPAGIVGHNTDVAGFDAAVLDLMKEVPHGAVVGLLGAGGSAAAALAAISAWPGARALVANRTSDRARDLVARFGAFASQSDVASIAREADLVVNATSIGLRDDDPLPIDPALLRPQCAVLDLVYSPNETRLVHQARDAGHPAIDGLAMLCGQGAHAFGWWFNTAPNVEVMWEALRKARAGASDGSRARSPN
jgi:shikimate dehydrogenase